MKRFITGIWLITPALLFMGLVSIDKPGIHLIGDSTMADKPLDKNPERGWGQVFPRFFKNDVKVINYARNGRSTKSFIKEGLWENVYNNLKPGDYVFIQFGHNDAKINDTSRYAAPNTTYRKNLIKFIEESRSRGAIPVLITPVARRKFSSEGVLIDTHSEYPGVVKDVATGYSVPLIDLHASSMKLLSDLGPEKSKQLFLHIPAGVYKAFPEGKSDNTHFNQHGAIQIAQMVVQGMQAINLPVIKYLRDTPEFHAINTIIVDKNGGGHFNTLSEAIASLPMFNYQRMTIFIKNGVYEEKIRIEQDYITLEGESRDNTIIQYNQLREDWNKNKDPLGPAVINIHADDVILKNLTIENTQPKIGPHAFAIYGKGTRTILLNCNVVSKGGDTVSLWNYKTGMYYHANCYFEGAVDFVCPRGWCFIKDSKFFEVRKTAALWHAGGFDVRQKLVIVNSIFDGVMDFKIGRHHYEAQFYLIDCTFSENMKDQPIYRVTYEDNTRNRPFNWGPRYYFYGCQRKGGKFDWFEDNLDTAPGSPETEDLTAYWTFDGQWDPESSSGPEIIRYEIHEDYMLLFFNEIITVLNTPVLKSKNGQTFTYHSGGGSDTIRFNTEKPVLENDLIGLKIINGAKLIGTKASARERLIDLSVLSGNAE